MRRTVAQVVADVPTPSPRETEVLEFALFRLGGIDRWSHRYPTLDEVRDALEVTSNPHAIAWLRAAERRMAAGATSPFEARSEAEEADNA